MRIVVALIIVLLGLGIASAQNVNSVHWEVRRYFGNSSMAINEFMLVIQTAGAEDKVFVGTARFVRKVPCLSFWTGQDETLFSPDGKQIGISDFSIDFDTNGIKISRLYQFWPFSPVEEEPPHKTTIQYIELPRADEYVTGPPVFVDAAARFTRPLLLESPVMRGDDVWILQRYLGQKGYHMPGGLNGVFDADTEALVRLYQTGQSFPAVESVGVVDRNTWEYLAQPHPELKEDCP